MNVWKINIIDVFAVYGDSGNVGDGCLIGVFIDKNAAESAAVGRGNLDCGGDGIIKEKKAVMLDGGEIYLLELNFPIKPNMVIKPNPRDIRYDCEIMVISVSSPIDFMRIIRRRTGMGLREAKDLLDKIRNKGRIKIDRFNPDSKYSLVTKEEFIEWKQELMGIAEIEAV